jgi:hypothetical protein
VQWCRYVETAYQAGAMVFGQRGRELPKMFGNLDAVHADGSGTHQMQSLESPETLRFEQSLEERFLPLSSPGKKRTFRVDENYDAPQ